MIDMALENLELSPRAENVLKNGGITTLEHLLKESCKSLLKIQSCGNATIGEFRCKLALCGLALKGDILITHSAGSQLMSDVPNMCEKIIKDVRSMSCILQNIKHTLNDLEETISSIVSNENYKNNR